ncbi:MAG: hypothetical protein DRP08_04175 [Candidatus Aenigmatarchaeota archaeon]|nr:MAG: hypothetical protein DRP08_04175 [Candidatus Aenigmarchaeota archaeon]
MMKKISLLLVLVIFNVQVACALVIQGIESNQDTYSNGDLIQITVYANEVDLQVTADFSKVDSLYSKEMVISEESEPFVYKVYYPISFGNTKGEGLHNVVLSVYSRKSETSSIASYGIDIDNTERINRTSDKDEIKLKVRKLNDNPPIVVRPDGGGSQNLVVQDGMIMICDSSDCKTLTEEDYEAGRRIIITDGTVELADLTYNQLKSQIETDVSKKTQAEVQKYINQIIGINKKLENAVSDVKSLVVDAEVRIENNTARAEKIVEYGLYANIAAIVLVIIIIAGVMYAIYLKTHSTWLG